MNHGGTVSSLCRRQILVFMQREVVGAKTVAQSIFPGRDFLGFAEFDKRRVEMCIRDRAAWLEPYRQHKGPLWTQSHDTYHAAFVELRESQKIPARKNGLRHAFCTYRCV